MRRILLAAAFVAGGALVVQTATPATAGCEGSIGVVDIGGVVYFSDHDGGTWFYLETNGQPGLQRGGSSGAGLLAGQPGFDDTCSESDNPDTTIL